MKAELGLYGGGRVGRNLAKNAAGRGLGVRLLEPEGAVLPSPGRDPGLGVGISAADPADLVASLEPPRRLILCLPPGEAVDEAVEVLTPLLEKGDLLVDAGDSWYRDSERRERGLAARGLRFAALGVSGGAEGALQGPSFMAGGEAEVAPLLLPLLERLAARGPDGAACAAWLGPVGAGHFAKMTHNAIEYAEMELIAEAYHVLKASLRASRAEARDCFAAWERSEVASHLLSLAVDVLSKDDEDGAPLIDRILDRATQKGTGLRAVECALEFGVQASTLAEAVFARNLSVWKDERVQASALLGEHRSRAVGSPEELMEELRRAVLAAKIIAYSEGFALLSRASELEGWALETSRIAHLWRAGALIRSPFLDHVAEAFGKPLPPPTLIHDAKMKLELDRSLPSLRRVVARSVESGLPLPLMAAAVSSFDGQRSAWLPANLIQALRDRFGGHGFERVDRPRGEIHHASWAEEAGP